MNQHGNNSVTGVIRNRLIRVFCPLDSILLYLPDLYTKGLQYRTINSHRNAFSITHLPVDNVCIEHMLWFQD